MAIRQWVAVDGLRLRRPSNDLLLAGERLRLLGLAEGRLTQP
jgi:hypothetical protein